MKTLLLGLISLFLISFSLNASADKIIIKGTPIVVERQADVYVPSTTVTTVTNDPYYFSINNSNRVCYTETQPALTKIDVGAFDVRVGDEVVKMHCYEYSPDYFVVQ